MENKTNLDLLYDITQEGTDIVIHLDTEHKELKFQYFANKDSLEQSISETDRLEYQDNPEQLLKYVLEEVLCTILGAKEL